MSNDVPRTVSARAQSLSPLNTFALATALGITACVFLQQVYETQRVLRGIDRVWTEIDDAPPLRLTAPGLNLLSSHAANRKRSARYDHNDGAIELENAVIQPL